MTYSAAIWQHGWQTMGWTMVYFLGAGSLFILAASVLRFVMRRTAPQLRYAVSLGMFTTLALLPFGIAAWLISDSASDSVDRAPLRLAVPKNSIDSDAVPTIELRTAPDALPYSMPNQSSSRADQDQGLSIELNPVQLTESESYPWLQTVDYLPWLWLVGTPLTFVLLATGLVGTERLRRSGQAIVDGPIYESCQRLSSVLRIGRNVAIAVSDRVASPLLVGIVRPLILLPPAAITGWSAAELEMVLLHELAHVRRWDNLVNLLQRLVESALFFHPGVWLASRWVRRDREDCCDAVVLKYSTSQPQAYAELLVQLATPHAPLAGLAMAQHPLAGRIRRILRIPEEPMRVARSTIAVVGGLLVTLVIGVGWYNPAVTEAEEATAELGDSLDGTTEDTKDRERPTTAEIAGSAEQIILESLIPDDLREEKDRNRIIDSLKRQGFSAEIGEHKSNGGSTLLYNILVRVPPGSKIVWEGHDDGPRPRVIVSNSESASPSEAYTLSQIYTSDSPFPSLEEQKAADLAYKLLGVELEKLRPDELEMVQEHKFSGGLRIGNQNNPMRTLLSGDILVGLHVWPTTSLEDVMQILTRDDLEELLPLKFYVVREGNGFGDKGTRLVTGRVVIDFNVWRELQQRKDSHNTSSEADRQKLESYRKQLREQLEELDIKIEKLEEELVQAKNSQRERIADMKLREVRQQRLRLLEKIDELSELGQFLLQQRQSVSPPMTRTGTAYRAPSARVQISPDWQPGSPPGRLNPTESSQSPKQDPKEYKLRAGDVVHVAAIEVFTDYPLNHDFTIEPMGTIALGPKYGRVQVAGQTVYEAEQSVKHELLKIFTEVSVQITLRQKANQQTASGPDHYYFKKNSPAESSSLPKLEGFILPPAPEVPNSKTISSPAKVPSTPVPTPPSESNPFGTRENLPKLLYDGKTFEWWRDAWKTELKIEKRIECIEALAAFGRAGRGKEAAEVILQVAAEYDYLKPGGSERIQKLKNAIQEVLTQPQGLPYEAWVPRVLQLAEDNPDQWREFAVRMLVMVHDSFPEIDGLMREVALSAEHDSDLRKIALSSLTWKDGWTNDKELVAFVRKALQGEDPELTSKLVYVLWFRDFDEFPEQLDLLFHEDDSVAETVLMILGGLTLPNHASEVLDKLLAVVDDPTRAKDHQRVVEALARMGRSAFSNNPVLIKRKSKVIHRLRKILAEGETLLLPQAIIALKTLSNESETLVIKNLLKEYPDVSAARRRDLAAAAEEAKQISQVRAAAGRYGGGFGGGGGGF